MKLFGMGECYNEGVVLDFGDNSDSYVYVLFFLLFVLLI